MGLWWVLFAVFAVNAPDLDYLVGLAVGDLGRFHRGNSHSLGAALIFGAAVGVLVVLAGRGSSVRIAAWASVLYASHMVLDLLGLDNGGPSGMPLLWPGTDLTVVWPWPLLPGLTNATEGAQVGRFIRSLVTMSNAWVVVVELLVVGPLALFAWLRVTDRERPCRARPPGRVRGEGESTLGGTP